MTKKRLALVIIASLLIAASVWFFVLKDNSKDQPPQENNDPKTEEVAQPDPQVTPPEPAFNKQLYSIDDPGSPWIISNKKRPLPAGFIPPNLTAVGNTQLQAEAANAVKTMINEAKKQGVSLRTISGYRSYNSQSSVYNSYVATDGQAKTDTYSSRPGYSEHQTGLAVDMGDVGGRCDLEICYFNTPGGQWIAKNAHLFGFTIRYQENKTNITGYQYEPWHLRYVGAELATELHKSGQTMEEFFGLPPAPGY